MRFWLWILALGLLAPPVPALAGIFAGASLGQSGVEDTQLGTDFDADDTGRKFFGGFRILKFFGIEGGYVDFGTANDVFPGASFSADLSGWNLFAVGTVPLGTKFEIQGKAGLVYWDLESSFSVGMSSGGVTDDGVDTAWGVGVAFQIAPHVHLRGEWELFDIGSVEEATFTSAGIEIRF